MIRGHRISPPVLIAAALIWLTFGLSACSPGVAESAAAPELIVPVEAPADIVEVTRGDIQPLKVAEGSVIPYSQGLSFLSADAPILTVHVAHGQNVTEGELLAELDEAVWLGRLDEAREELAHATRVLEHENLLGGIALEKARIAVETARNDDEATVARLELEALETRDAIRRETAALDSERLETNIARLEARKDDYKIYAPFDGVILHIEDLQPGDYPSGRVPFMYIADLNRLTVRCTTEQTSFFSGSQSVTAGIGDVELPVELIPYSLEEQLAFYYEGITPPARFGFTGEVNTGSVQTDKRVLIKAYGFGREDVLTIPINAAHLETGGAEEGAESRQDFAYVDVNGARERRDIRCGLRSDVRIEVLEGLTEGERIYVD